MIRAACHCGAVRFELAEPPAWVMECNCSICRRHGAMWAYYRGAEEQKTLLRRPDPAATEAYVWGDRMLGLRHCRTCPCVTHAEGLDGPEWFAVNARMMVGLDPKTVEIRQVDNGHTGFFWTTSDRPPRASNHPPMPPDPWR